MFTPDAKQPLQTAWDFFLITSWKPAVCVITPVKLCLPLPETTPRSQVVTRDPEQREAAGGEISECDSLLQFIHRVV